MNTKYTLFILPILLTLIFSACSLETDNVDGHLEGMWHLVSIEAINADTAQSNATTDLSKQYLFWSFQSKLLEIDDKSGAHSNYLFKFNISGNTLTIHDPYLYNREEGDQKLEDATPLAAYGITALSEQFTFHASGSNLIMESATHRLRFKKF